MKGTKYYSVIGLSVAGILSIGIGIIMLLEGGIAQLNALSNGSAAPDDCIQGIAGLILILFGIVSYKPLDAKRKQLREEYEYDENGVSRKRGKFSDLSAQERVKIEEQKMLDAERILDSPTVKKITHKGEEDPVAAMDHLVGLPKIKNQMREMAARMQYELQEYEKTGKKLKKGQTIPHSSMHMCFFGPPGTGKTTCARIMTGFLYQYRYIKKNQCVEVDGNFFRGMAPGESTKKTRMLIQRALGGVLFIDEAYSLVNSADRQEVIATIVKEMEDRREDLIVIFAGYDREMRQFLDTNPGLRSRIKYDLWFGNYTINDLSEIFRISANEKGFVVSADMDTVFRERIEKEMHAKDFGNARTVRTLLEKVIDRHAANIIDHTLPETDRYVLQQCDMPAAGRF